VYVINGIVLSSYLYPGFMLGGFNSNASAKFVQLHHFHHKILRGTNYIASPLGKKLGDKLPVPTETRSLKVSQDIFSNILF